ncbi:HAMP domain-containing protein [Deinococcus frigens]|uniref:HAMP domain-containing protein n=1 Tax=Deinococcus frigens TaxID=249403 RepID=UPI00049551EE|nr:HAMP domain-containing protein [Deinococcus frigens]
MRYTVIIQQPVQAECRRGLEQQLAERFNLSAEQAARLSGRRTGCLMKPTSRARAELLLDVFLRAGAAVTLEEVQEETRMTSQPYQGPAPSPALPYARSEALEEAFLAPPMPAPAWPDLPQDTPPSPFDSMSSLPARTSPFAPAALGSAAHFPGGGVAVASPAVGTDTALDRPFGSVLSGPSTPPSHIWPNFTDALTLTDASFQAFEMDTVASPSPAAQPMVPVVLPAKVGESEPQGPRRSLTRQLTLGTLALSSAVTLGVLAVALPPMQRQAAQTQARTLAAAMGASLGSGPQSNAQLGSQLSTQLGALAATPGIGFVRAELPGGQTTLRAQDAGVGNRSGELSAWLGSHPNGGTLKLGGTRYVIAQAAFRENAAGGAEVIPAGEAPGAAVLGRVVVGIPNTQSALRAALPLALLAVLLGLAVAAWLASRAARQVTQPIERLVRAANAISMGDLSRPVHPDHNDETGDLAQALERMRQSLEAATEGLSRHDLNHRHKT